MVYNIQTGLKDYHGLGKAWASIKDGEVIALRYMGDFAPKYKQAPEWAKAAHRAYSILKCEIKNISPTHLALIKKAAIAAGHPNRGTRGGNIKASYIASMAQYELEKSEKEEFAEYRNNCRQELAELGEVLSGQCSCYQFII